MTIVGRIQEYPTSIVLAVGPSGGVIVREHDRVVLRDERGEELIAGAPHLTAAQQLDSEIWWITRTLVAEDGATIVGNTSERLRRGTDGFEVDATVPGVRVADGLIAGASALAPMSEFDDGNEFLVRVDLRTKRRKVIAPGITFVRRIAEGALAFTFDGWLGVFDRSLRERWRTERAAPIVEVHEDINGIAVVHWADGTFVGIRQRDGQELWRRALGERGLSKAGAGRVYVVAPDATVEILDGASGATTAIVDSRCGAISVDDHALGAYGKVLFVAGEERCVRVLEETSGEVLQILRLPAGFTSAPGPAALVHGKQVLLPLTQSAWEQRGRSFGLLVLEEGDGPSEVIVQPRPAHRIEQAPAGKLKFGVNIALRARTRLELLRYSQILLQDVAWTYARTANLTGNPHFNGTIRLSVARTDDGASHADVRAALPMLTFGMEAMGASTPGARGRPLTIEVDPLPDGAP